MKMYEIVPDNYDAFEEYEREIERINRLNDRISHECGDIKERLNGPGYREIETDIFVSEEDAYKYALERISQDENLKQEFVELFYSGNWVKED